MKSRGLSKAAIAERRKIVEHMLRRDLAGEEYVLPSWWTGPRPERAADTKDNRAAARTQTFRKTGDLS